MLAIFSFNCSTDVAPVIMLVTKGLSITKALAKSPDWQVDVPSDAELNVMIAEEKTLRQAIEILNKGDEIKKQVDSIINEKTKPYQELSGLNKTHLQYAVLMEGTVEKKFFDTKYNELVDESYVQSLQQQISNKKTEELTYKKRKNKFSKANEKKLIR